MSWRDELLPASFRGVGFKYADVSGEGGRRLAVHEYPLRDDPSVEDMGRRVGGFRVAGYVLGPDYGAARDALIDALNAKGPGTFQHPFKGPISVAVGPFRYRETRDEGGYCEFEIEFVEAGKAPSPTSTTSTAQSAATKAKSAMGTLQTAFAGLYKIAGYPARLASEAQKLTGKLTDALSPLGDAVSLLQADATMFLDGLNELKLAVLEPVSFASSVVSFFQTFADDVADFVPSFDESNSSRGPSLTTDPSYGLAALTTWGADLAPVVGDIPVRLQQQANQDALTGLVQGVAVCALAQIYAATEFVSLAEAGTARDQLVTTIDAIALAAADRGQNEVYQALVALEQAVTDDLTIRGKQLPDVVTVDLPGTMPSVVVAQRLYRDASRAGELVARNVAPHPLFMPKSIEALSS